MKTDKMFISKKEMLERICDLETDIDMNAAMIEDITKRLKKIEKAIKPAKNEKT